MWPGAMLLCPEIIEPELVTDSIFHITLRQGGGVGYACYPLSTMLDFE